MKLAATVTLAAALLAGCMSMTNAPVRTANGVLTGPNSMTLYTFDRDTPGNGKSVCNGPCEALWPPMLASASDKPTGDYTIVTRDDGKKQWASKGRPLYFWAKDTKVGDRTGDGVNNVWKLARP